ncbi:MAG: SDR family oxidoreductase [Kangiellaceae bacterium]
MRKLEGFEVNVVGRSKPSNLRDEYFFKGDFASNCNLYDALRYVDVVIHCAARVHLMVETSTEPLIAYRRVNTEGTINFAKQAAVAGVKRFIFISTIKVNGEETSLDTPFTAADRRLPQDPYGVSKSEAEQQLLNLSSKTGMEVVIIRPPLIYGPGVQANFASLMNLISRDIPLPFACFNMNKRSMVSIYNLVDLIFKCIDHPKATNEVFLVSDDEDLSTIEIIKRLCKACGKNAFMLPVPVGLFQFAGLVTGKSREVKRLTNSLHVDISKTKELLGWIPPMSVDEGFKRTADAFFESKREK